MSLIQPQSQGMGFLFGGDDEPNISEPSGWYEGYSDWDMWFDSYFGGGSGFGSEGGEYWGDPFGLGWYDLGDGYWYDPYTDSIYYTGGDSETVGDDPIRIGSESCAERWSPGCEADLPYGDLPDWFDYPMNPGIPGTTGSEPYDWGTYSTGEGVPLPGYCPTGTYHPYPIGHPQQNECAPFPTNPTQRRQAQQQEQQRQQQARQAAQQQQQRGQQQCKANEYFSLKQRRCLPIPRCSAEMRFDRVAEQCVCAASGTVLNRQTGKCVKPTRSQLPQKPGQSLPDLLKKMPFPMWIILALVIALMLSGNKGSGTTTTITKRKAR